MNRDTHRSKDGRNKGTDRDRAKEGVNMESVKSLEKNGKESVEFALSPIDKALEKFKSNNGYDFLDIINNPRIRSKHNLRQLQKKNYDDSDFLEAFQDEQGD